MGNWLCSFIFILLPYTY